MSRKRSKWKFSPARKRRPVERTLLVDSEREEISAEPDIAEETAAEEAVAEEVAAEEAAAEEVSAEEAAAEEAVAEEVAAEEAVAEETAGEEPCIATVPAEDAFETEQEISESEEHRSTLEEVFGEETSAAKELPDYFFDEEDDLPEALKKTAESENDKDEGPEETSVDDIFEYEDLDDDQEDEFLDEPQLSLYERGPSGKRHGKKKESGKKKKDRKRDPEKKGVRIGDLVLGDGEPKICVSITGKSREQIMEQAGIIADLSPDLVEWRVDYLQEAGGKKDIIDILVALKRLLGDTPLLFTYRTEGEGGYGRVGWGHYSELLEWAACRPEIDLIDVEAMGLDVDTEGLIRIIHGRGTPVIASVHYCGEMPGKKERKEALRFLKQSGGDIIKMAFTPRNEEDVLDLMVWTRKHSKKMEQPLITMAMGDVGRVSRVSGRLTGSAVTFGYVGEASAPGQIPASELKNILDQI